MKKFSDFNIKPVAQGLQGDKIKIERILNCEIIVEKYKIEDSKFSDKGNGKCLYLQILKGTTQHVVFSGSGALMEIIKQVPEDAFPFKTTIIKNNDRLEFS